MLSGKAKPELPIRAFASAREWEDWLAAQPRTSGGVWLKLAKKQSGAASVSRREAIDAALCHGWIDGQLAKSNDKHWLVRFTPRAAKSKWSAVNTIRAQELTADGRMRPAGLAEIESAKKDGRWVAAYPPQSKAPVPADLEAALQANPAAHLFFSKLDSANRYAILYRVHHAKDPARASKIEKFVQMLARGKTIHPPRTKNLP